MLIFKEGLKYELPNELSLRNRPFYAAALVTCMRLYIKALSASPQYKFRIFNR